MKTNPTPGLRRVFALAGALAAAHCAQAATETNWIVFNDHRPTEGVTHINANGYDMLATGNGGVLRDFNTGNNLPVRLDVTSTGTPDDFGANNYFDADSPAFNLFDGIVDTGNEGIPGVRASQPSSITLTFSGLDPGMKYTFYGSSSRGNNYNDRWAQFTLEGIDSATAAHVNASANTNIFTKATFPDATLGDNQVALNSGENRVGSLVGWTNIDPGEDGTFSIKAEQYVGPAPFGTPSAAAYGYAFHSIYLAEVGEVLPIKITAHPTSATNAPGQTATFSVTVTGTGPTYQWQKAAAGSDTFTDIAGATSASYTTPALTPGDDAARYRVIVSIPDVSITSRVATLSVQGAPIDIPGLLKMEIYDGITGGTVFDLSGSPKFPDSPDRVVYIAGFDTQTAFPTDVNNNYGARISGFIVPTESGNYEFFLRSDDGSELYLSSDQNPANLQLIAYEETCCGPFEEPGFVETSLPVALVAGNKYAVQALLKEGTGGDFLQVAWRKAGDTNAAATLLPLSPAFVATTAPAQGSITITAQPVSVTAAQNSTVDLSVGATSARTPLLVQWQKNGVTVPGLVGTNVTYGPLTPADNNVEFKALLSVPGATLLSSGATITVTNDSTAPTVVSAQADESLNTITVRFSEAVTAATAGAAANYTVTAGGTTLAVQSVQVIDPTTVRLTTAAQAPGTTYTLAVQNVRDTANNTVAANETATFSSFTALRGGLKFEAYAGITGTPVDNLRNNPNYPGNPSFVGYVTSLDTRTIYPDDTHNDYGARLSGWLVPAESGNYTFFLRSDDAGELWLSTDETAANLVKIAEELDCCGGFIEPDLGDPATSLPVALVAGRRYYIEAIYKEGGGGDYLQVAWRKEGDTTPSANLTPIPGSVLEVMALPGTLTPPTVSFTSPQNNALLATGSNVDLVVQAAAGAGKQITKVEFWQGAAKIAELTNAPYSITITNLADNVYDFLARATDSAGLYTETAPLRVFIGERLETRVLVAITPDHIWRFNREAIDLGTEWRELNYDDSTWQQGAALIADETGGTVEPIRTPVSRMSDFGDYVKTMYFRYKFNWTGTNENVRLALRHVIDDGAVVYINGTEVHRFGIAAGPVDYNTDASGHEQAYAGPIEIPASVLREGQNVIAVEVHQSGGSSSDIVFGAELIANIPLDGGPGEGAEFTRVQRTGNNITLEWTGGGTLQSRASLSAGSWTDVPTATSPHSAPISGGTMFFRVRN